MSRCRRRARGFRPWAPGYASGPLVVLNIRATIAEQLEWLDREQPAYLLVYPSVLRALVERCRARGRGLASLRGVTTFGEMLPEDVALLCERELGVPLRDLYSAVEVGTVALQPRQGSHYLVQAERILVEILDASGAPCRPGTIGRVVATPLHNFAMPLLRYDLGDFAEAGGADPGGSGLPVLNRVMGRVRNLLTLPSGERIFPSFIHAVRAEPAVRQFQIVQKSRERLELRLAVAAPLDAAREEGLAARLAHALGHRFALDFIYVESIAADPSGKYEDFKSEVV